jgi:hypothetical protein
MGECEKAQTAGTLVASLPDARTGQSLNGLPVLSRFLTEQHARPGRRRWPFAWDETHVFHCEPGAV